MQEKQTRPSSFTRRAPAGLTALAAASVPFQTMAALPTQTPPTSVSAGSGDWLNLILGYIGDAGLVAGLAIAVIGFLYVSYAGYQKFNEARQNRAEWGEVITLAIVGAGLLMISSFLLTEASNVITGTI